MTRETDKVLETPSQQPPYTIARLLSAGCCLQCFGEVASVDSDTEWCSLRNQRQGLTASLEGPDCSAG